ncbi:MAG: hypothetical protein AB7T01_11055 [Acidithiobacillus sp.]
MTVLLRSLTFCVLACAGCATYGVNLQPLGKGPMAYGTAYQQGKRVKIPLDGEEFTGTYSVNQFGAFSLANIAGVEGSAVALGSVGNGMALLHAPNGDNLACVFQWDAWNQDGEGKCLLDGKTPYLITIYKK